MMLNMIEEVTPEETNSSLWSARPDSDLSQEEINKRERLYQYITIAREKLVRDLNLSIRKSGPNVLVLNALESKVVRAREELERNILGSEQLRELWDILDFGHFGFTKGR